MQVIGIDKSLRTMEDAIVIFEEQSKYKLNETERAIFQFSWLTASTAAMKETMGMLDRIEEANEA